MEYRYYRQRQRDKLMDQMRALKHFLLFVFALLLQHSCTSEIGSHQFEVSETLKECLRSLDNQVYRSRFHPDYFGQGSIESFISCHKCNITIDLVFSIIFELANQRDPLKIQEKVDNVKQFQQKISCLNYILPIMAPHGLEYKLTIAWTIQEAILQKIISSPRLYPEINTILSTNKEIADAFADTVILNLLGYERELKKPIDPNYLKISEGHFPRLKGLFFAVIFKALYTGEFSALGMAFCQKERIYRIAILLHSPDQSERIEAETILKIIFQALLKHDDLASLSFFVNFIKSGFFDFQEHKDEVSLRPIAHLISILAFISQTLWPHPQYNGPFLLIVERQFVPLLKADAQHFRTFSDVYQESLFGLLETCECHDGGNLCLNWVSSLLKYAPNILQQFSKKPPNGLEVKIQFLFYLLGTRFVDIGSKIELFQSLYKLVRSPFGHIVQEMFLNKAAQELQRVDNSKDMTIEKYTPEDIYFNIIALTICKWYLEDRNNKLPRLEKFLMKLAQLVMERKQWLIEAMFSKEFISTIQLKIASNLQKTRRAKHDLSKRN